MKTTTILSALAVIAAVWVFGQTSSEEKIALTHFRYYGDNDLDGQFDYQHTLTTEFNRFGQDSVQWQVIPLNASDTLFRKHQYYYFEESGKIAKYYVDNMLPRDSVYRHWRNTTYAYLPSWKISQITDSVYDTYSNVWIPARKNEYFYYRNLDLEHVDKYDYDGGWVPASRDLYYYDDQHRITTLLHELYSPDIRDFYEDTKTTYEYSGDTLMIVHEFVYDSSAAEWSNLERFYYHYLPDGKPSLIIWEKWDSDLNDFVNFMKLIYVYGSQDQLLSQDIYVWDSSQNAWYGPVFQTFFYYDLSIPGEQLNIPQHNLAYDRGYFTFKIDSLKSILGGTIYEKYEFEYSPLTVLHSETSISENIYVYPNPAVSFLTVAAGPDKIARITVYDSAGKRVYDKSYGNIIDLRNWKPGVYYYQIVTTNGDIKQGSFIKSAFCR